MEKSEETLALVIKIALDSWFMQIKKTDDLFNAIPDEDLMLEIAPGKNRGIYLLGHLAAVHDSMLPLLNMGDMIDFSMPAIFVHKPDTFFKDLPSIAEIRNYWKAANENLETNFRKLAPEAWLEKHNSISAEDFVKEPHRNRLSVLHSRTVHLASHYGQLLYLKK